MSIDVARLDAELYDSYVPGWPGEMEFYHALAAQARAAGAAVLEVGCGTGRVTIPLARAGTSITGLDLSAAMLDVARRNSQGMPNVQWVHGDMRAFELGEHFGLVIIPGHAFQFMLTPGDQLACLACIRQHMGPEGTLVVHLDHQHFGWLGGISGAQAGVFTPGYEVAHPDTGQVFRSAHAWSYAPATQTATLVKVWDQLGADGAVVERCEREPIALHCVFRFEMEHLLYRAGFEVQAVYGDFDRGALRDDSQDMVWVALRV